MPPPRFDLVIFDCDGVLVDSEVISVRTLLSALADEGADVDLPYAKAHYLGRSFASVIADFPRLTGRAAPDNLEAGYLARLFAAYRSELQATEGALDLVAAMRGHYCMATSSNIERAKLSLELTGLLPFFRESIFCAAMVARGKPAPDLFLHAAAACGAEPARCLVIEDSEVGVLAGLNAGMTVWRFAGGSHFGPDHALPSKIAARVPTFHSMRELAQALAAE